MLVKRFFVPFTVNHSLKKKKLETGLLSFTSTARYLEIIILRGDEGDASFYNVETKT